MVILNDFCLLALKFTDSFLLCVQPAVELVLGICFSLRDFLKIYIFYVFTFFKVSIPLLKMSVCLCMLSIFPTRAFKIFIVIFKCLIVSMAESFLILLIVLSLDKGFFFFLLLCNFLFNAHHCVQKNRRD